MQLLKSWRDRLKGWQPVLPPPAGLALWLAGAALALLAAVVFAPPAVPDHPGPDVQRVTEAWFEVPGRVPERVRLPDTWAYRGVDHATPGRYRFTFELDGMPGEALALIFTRLSTWHQIHVNGELADGRAQGPGEANPGVPVPALVSVPPSLLRPGLNEVTVDVRYTTRAGLSDVEIGPMSTLRQTHQRRLISSVALPQALNLGAAGLAVFLLLIWRQRRKDLTLGSFGALMLLGSVRNYTYFMDTALVPARASDWFFYTAQVWSAVLLGVFAQAYARQRWPRYTRLLVAAAVVLPVVGAWAAAYEALQAVRIYTYPLLLLSCLPVLWLTGRAAWMRGGKAAAALAIGVACMLAAVLHDYAMQTANWLPITESYLLPYVMPLSLGAFSMALLQRMVRAMSEVEVLNVHLERRVAERTAEMERANAAKTRFLASASHDLRQPLVTIGLLVGMVKDSSVSPPPQVRKLLDRLDEAVGAMEGLLTGLLDLSQLESGSVTPHRAPVRVSDLFDAIEVHEQPAAAMKGLRLRLRPTALVVESDPVMLDRIVRNLVGNAVKYTREGGVLVAARRRGDRVRIEVYDTGIGIAPEHQEAIFQEFVQLNNPQRERSRGMGLGLAIVQRSAAMLGHPVGLRSQPGQGSCFWIELPLVPEAVPAPAAPQPVPRLRGRCVVIVEDDPAVREALNARMELWQAQVDVFESVAALRRWLDGPRARRPDLLVSDYRLPDGDGLQVIAAVRERFGALPAVIITGDTAPAELARMTAAGVRVLHKPFRAEALLDALQA
ncbi:hybrid sensor histidine kinase/response regulator [Caldimonas thermodepolymerans]|uniref:histidine kinase n=1 Tax=Caldimonas thermodepolymerans TaxID=215580 RepID=A0AA46DE80_9BURK|nr:hybrid sensor histidine kinase/response regulator [Caldimonas thermodepolymerans]TCP07690.1 signal transduction histidine kinase [Caldimonas thermodepolymerans]UZG44191.1 ATP-binding protein [Caldimonas thermodepolymerans]UZG47857.1 ATP-binding protein [Caldimonas thermodepolymerans]